MFKFFFWIRDIGFHDIDFLCVCKALVFNKQLSSAPSNQSPVPGCRQSSSCALILHVCWCVCLYVLVKM